MGLVVPFCSHREKIQKHLHGERERETGYEAMQMRPLQTCDAEHDHYTTFAVSMRLWCAVSTLRASSTFASGCEPSGSLMPYSLRLGGHRYILIRDKYTCMYGM